MHSLAELSKHLELESLLGGAAIGSPPLWRRPGSLALLDLKGVGRVRARKLQQSGITNREKLKSTDRGDRQASWTEDRREGPNSCWLVRRG